MISAAQILMIATQLNDAREGYVRPDSDKLEEIEANQREILRHALSLIPEPAKPAEPDFDFGPASGASDLPLIPRIGYDQIDFEF